MNTVLNILIAILQFTAGQRFWIYERMRPIAVALGLPFLVRHIDRASAHEERLRDLENKWSGEGTRTLYSPQVTEVDGLVDQTLTAIRDIVVSQSRGLEPTDPIAVSADAFLAEIFPNGVQAVTNLPYIDQVLAVEIILGKLQNALAGAVTELGLSTRVRRLTELNAEYRRLINLDHGKVEYSEIQEGRQLGQRYLREIIAMVLGTFFDSDDPVHVSNREELLAPVMAQLEIQRARARARRRGNGGSSDAGDELVGAGEEASDDVVDDVADDTAAGDTAESADSPVETAV